MLMIFVRFKKEILFYVVLTGKQHFDSVLLVCFVGKMPGTT